VLPRFWLSHITIAVSGLRSMVQNSSILTVDKHCCSLKFLYTEWTMWNSLKMIAGRLFSCIRHRTSNQYETLRHFLKCILNLCQLKLSGMNLRGHCSQSHINLQILGVWTRRSLFDTNIDIFYQHT